MVLDIDGTVIVINANLWAGSSTSASAWAAPRREVLERRSDSNHDAETIWVAGLVR